MKTFDLTNSPLFGTNLIEASAGTGKTYTITGLYLRLILEEDLLPGQILVVTFTKAATAELKDRIRRTLLQAKSAFSAGSSADVFLDALVKKYDDSSRAIQYIQDALLDFDKASIFTIHGFCQRILQESAFETRSLFDTELVTDPSILTQEIAEDFWRRHVYTMPPELISYAFQKVKGPDFFLKLLTQKKSPEIKIVPEVEQPVLSSLDDFRKIYNKLKEIWPASRKEVIGLLKAPALSGTVYGSLKTLASPTGISRRDLMVMSMTEAMDSLVDRQLAGFPLDNNFRKFTAGKLSTATRKNHTSPSHEVFDTCEALYQKGLVLESEMERYLLFLKSECFKFAEKELAARKRDANIQFFDDLLLMLKKSLADDEGNVLAAAIRDKYKAALVDEFQDTDSVQYEIFSRLFPSKNAILFMIGDPKQSIYGFRGADIFAYMEAVRGADSKYTLVENWRSRPSLIAAVNTIFSNVKAPFIFDKIPFKEGIPGKKSEADLSRAPLTLWHVPFETAKSLNKTAAVQSIAEAVANEILRLISNSTKKGAEGDTDGFKPGDIAVLVRTNRQAKIIKAHLSGKRIPSVLYGAGNIFHTHEALEMEKILWSISGPANDRLFRSALVTDMLGIAGHELDMQAEEPHWWQARLAAFKEYFQIWQQDGFLRMLRLFLAREEVRGRMLTFSDGDRRLTNVLHLAEILQRESVENKLGPTGLVRWLSEQRQAASIESEANQLRLESDAYAVKIITIHKSKGLEYPVVFCPYGWEGSLIKGNTITFHENAEAGLPTLDLAPGQNRLHLIQAQNELLAENLRLLYVALTRAKKQCYLVWGCFNTAETSALAYLLHSRRPYGDEKGHRDIVAALESDINSKEAEEFLDDLKQLADRAGGSIELVPMPLEKEGEYHQHVTHQEKRFCREFSGKIDSAWKVASYSYLISKRILDEALPDRDAFSDAHPSLLNEREEVPATRDIFSFPKGTRAGIFFHDLLEHLDFVSKDPDHRNTLVQDKLKAYGFDAQWQAPINSMINKILAAPLAMGSAGLTLSSIGAEDRINEMEFYFPLNPVNPQKLKNIFQVHAGVDISPNFPQRIEKLTFPLAKGFMKGYVDLIVKAAGRFFLIDWKSNYLGSHPQDYSQAALNRTMNHDYYILQYYLYTLALHQFLQIRVPDYRYETDFGGVFYIFIRGVDPDQGPELGIYKDFPSPAVVNALGRVLIPEFDPRTL